MMTPPAVHECEYGAPSGVGLALTPNAAGQNANGRQPLLEARGPAVVVQSA